MWAVSLNHVDQPKNFSPVTSFLFIFVNKDIYIYSLFTPNEHSILSEGNLHPHNENKLSFNFETKSN